MRNKSNNKNFQKKKHNKREFLKTKTSEIVDYFPRDNNDEDFGFNLASMETKNSIFSSKSELLKKKRKQESSKNKKKEKNLEEELEDLDFITDENQEKITSRALLPNFKVGDLVLLCICEIRQNYMIANYTRNKKAMIHVNYSGFDIEKEDNFSFKNYFRIGQFVCGAVVSPGNDIQLPQGYMNKKITVSIDPKIVNTGIKKETLVEGMDLWGKFIFNNNLKCYSADFSFTDADEELEKFNKNFNDYEAQENDFEENENNEEMQIEEEGEEFDDEDDKGMELNEEENNEENEEMENSRNSQEPEEFEFKGDDSNDDENDNYLNFKKKGKKNKNQKSRKKNKITNVNVNIIDLEKDTEYFDPEIIKSKTLNSYYFFKLIRIEKTDDGVTLHVSLNPNKLKFGIKKIEFSQIRPGFLFKTNLTRELLNGIEVAFAGNIGSIFSDHLKNSTKKSKNFLVRVTHVSVAKKNIGLSALTHITNLYCENILEKNKLVDNLFKNVKLDQELFGGSFLVNITENQIGFIHKKNIGEVDFDNKHNKKENKEDKADENEVQKINQKSKKNKKVRQLEQEEEIKPEAGAHLPLVLVKEFNYFDDRAVLKSVDLNENAESQNKKNSKTSSIEDIARNKIITWNTLKIGKLLTAKIKEVHSDHLIVAVNEFITGKITKDLLSDYHFTNIPKKFQVGAKINCRVFKFDYETKNLQLIAKESLMDESIILHESYESLKEGSEISVIYCGNGLFQHSGNIIGTLLNFSVYDKKENFKIGKAYNFNVFKVKLNGEKKKLYLSKEKKVYLPSFGDFENYLRRHPLLLTVVNQLNQDSEETEETLNKNKKNKKNKNLKNENKLSLDEIQEGNVYDFEIIPAKKILRLLEKKGIDLSLINEDIELLQKKVLFVKLHQLNFYGFLQVELLADFFNEKQFQIYYELGNNTSEILKELEKEKNLPNPLEGFDISENKNIMKKLLVVNFDKEKKIIFTSGKQSLIYYAENNLIPKTKEELFSSHQDNLICAYINKVNEKGVIVQFLGKYKFLIRNKNSPKDSDQDNQLSHSNKNELFIDLKDKLVNINDYYLSNLEQGQTILVAAMYDKIKNKVKFSTGLDVFKFKVSHSSVYIEEKIAFEAQKYLENYINEFKFVCLHNKIYNELNELNSEYNISECAANEKQNNFLEGIVGKLNIECNEINVNLKNHFNFKACIKINNSKFYNKDSSIDEIYKNYLNKNEIHKFLIYDLNYENETIYLTDNFKENNATTNKNSKKSDKKNKIELENSSQNFIVDNIFENYISCHLESDKNKKAILPCDLFNFNYAKLFNNLNTKNQTELDSLSDYNINNVNFSILRGDKIKCNVKHFDSQIKKYILEAPTLEILETIKSTIKHIVNYNPYSTSSSRKNSEFEKLVELIPGKLFSRRINGFKKNYVYIFIDKNTIGRINLKDFNGDHEEVKKLLKETRISRKESLNSIINDHNNLNESVDTLKSNLSSNLLKMKFKILHVEKSEKIRIVDLINVDTNFNEISDLSNITDKTKMDGETPLKGIVSKIDFNNKFPIRIDYLNSFEKRNKNSNKTEDMAFHIHYSSIHNFNLSKEQLNKKSEEEISNENIDINELFTLGQQINFYLKKEKDGSIVPSLIPFSKLPKKAELDKKYLIRILKSIPGRGLIVSIFDDSKNKSNNKEENDVSKIEAFVDITEISDELHGNPISLYKKGHIALGRIISFDSENSKKYFLSLRQSLTNDFLYDILKNGTTIKYKKYFDHFENSGDFRNKIFKFGVAQVLENKQTIMGYITASSEKGVFIKLGQDVIARAALAELSDEKATNPFLLYKQNQLVISRIIFIEKKESNNNNDKNQQIKISVSLRESVIKYNLSLKKKDLKQSNFYECFIMNETNEKYNVGIVGSTFVGSLDKNNNYMKKDANALKEIRDCLENKKTIILEVADLNTNVYPNIIKFSNINIEDQNTFDRQLVINLISEEDKVKYENNSELYNSVKMILEKEQENELTDELKELEKEAEDVDFEALLDKKDREAYENEENEENNENEENESEEIMRYDNDEDEDENKLIVKAIF